MKLTAELEATGGNTTGFRVPDEVVAELGGGGRPKIVATGNGYQRRTASAREGGADWPGVSLDPQRPRPAAPRRSPRPSS